MVDFGPLKNSVGANIGPQIDKKQPSVFFCFSNVQLESVQLSGILLLTFWRNAKENARRRCQNSAGTHK